MLSNILKSSITLTITLLLSFAFGLESYGQCDCETDRYTQQGMKELQKQGGFLFLRSYPVTHEREYRYSYIFSRGTKYMIALAEEEKKNPVQLIIYDSNGNEVASNVKDGKFYDSVIFSCKTTGIYRMAFAMENKQKECCAAGVLGISR